MTSEGLMAGKIAVVTGGGGGIGSAICRRLAEAGGRVVLTYRRSEEKTKAVAASLVGDGHLVVQAPVDDNEALQEMANRVAERYGTVDLLVNNAGVTRAVSHDDLDGLDDDLIDEIFRVNWRGAFASIRALKELLSNGEGGVVVNISSIAGFTAIGSNVAYCASKAAMNSMTISLGRALAPEIRVVSVSPGWVLGEYAKKVDPGYLQEQIDKTPLGRLATPEDVAEAVLAAATLLKYTTASIIPVDGGRPFI
ncbi:MAG: SDR family oxidoreductase [Anaerolineae bacterium]|nr:MAG: SDR family oxidoreductase [Anaerolineae bacterium]